MDRGLAILVMLLAVALLSAGCGVAATSGATSTAVNDPAAAYCGGTGGRVVIRYPTYGTNGPNPLRLAGALRFCQYDAREGSGADPQSRIHLSLETLSAERPTLAVQAYLGKPPIDRAPPGVNPASVYCSQLGGSDQFGGTNASGGGWATDDPGLVDQVLQTCVFPDLSTIDSFGLFYHANGTIRGIDLATVVRYRPSPPPATPGSR
jgi:putative hemolysin